MVGRFAPGASKMSCGVLVMWVNSLKAENILASIGVFLMVCNVTIVFGEVQRQVAVARAETVTVLPLDRYADIMQIHPAHFNQLQGAKAPLKSGCDKVWDQDARELLAWTMAQAEELIAIQLGYWPAPKFIVDEPRPFGITGVRSDWRNAEIRTEYGHVEAYGTEKLTLKQANATVEYLDLDADPLGREEVAEIGGSLYEDLSACNNACEVAVFFRVTDGAEDAADPRWEIRPLKVDIDGSTMRIRAEASMFVLPRLWDLTEADCVGSDEPNKWKWNYELANRVTQVDVYCRTVDPQLPVTLRWDGVCGCTTDVCEHSTQDACAYSTDLKRGYFIPRPATWNGTANLSAAPTYRTPPESVLVSYRAGLPLTRCRMNPNLERAIVKLTNVLLPEPPCGFCDLAEVRWKQDREDINPLTPEAAGMPWDLYKRGALEAWRTVKMMAMGRGGKLGRR